MNDVPIARDVVGCKVDPHGFATIDPFVQYVYGLPIFFSKFAIAVALIVSIKKPSEQVIFEYGDKILLVIGQMSPVISQENGKTYIKRGITMVCVNVGIYVEGVFSRF